MGGGAAGKLKPRVGRDPGLALSAAGSEPAAKGPAGDWEETRRYSVQWTVLASGAEGLIAPS